MKFTEASIQRAIHLFCKKKNHIPIAPNVYAYAWESDVLSLTMTHFVHEFEIKISRSDFKADLLKKKRHKVLSDKFNLSKPNYFWYICPENMITASDIPKYTGLLYICNTGSGSRLCKIKQAPRLHSDVASPNLIDKLFLSTYYKYWNLIKKYVGLEKDYNVLIQQREKWRPINRKVLK